MVKVRTDIPERLKKSICFANVLQRRKSDLFTRSALYLTPNPTVRFDF